MRRDALIASLMLLPRGASVRLPATCLDLVAGLPSAEQTRHAYETGRACEVASATIEERNVEAVRWREATEDEMRAVRERGRAPECGSRSVRL